VLNGDLLFQENVNKLIEFLALPKVFLLFHLLNKLKLLFESIVSQVIVKISSLFNTKVDKNLGFRFHIIDITLHLFFELINGRYQCFLKRHFISHKVILQFINFFLEIILVILVVFRLTLHIF